MAEIDRAEWDGLSGRYETPFLSWGFLALLEASGSICPETGWTPSHLLVRRAGRLVAAAPLYIKTHSWGEFVFDFQFAEAAANIGVPYYPKLVGVIPATPASVWRIMTAPGEDEEGLTALLVETLADAARKGDVGGLHFLWPAPEFAEVLYAMCDRARTVGKRAAPGSLDFLEWPHQSFLWEDSGYGDFEGYLGAFSKNMRRNLRRERAELSAHGIATRVIEAREARDSPNLLERMADFYEGTNGKFGPWAARFLSRDFFLRLPEFLPSGWVLGAGFEGNSPEPLGLSFLFEGPERLWGRYWGAARFQSSLHFELCYNLPIEYALARGIASFDPGMGGEHKARRGFRSLEVPSFHLVFDRRLAGYMRTALEAARAEEAEHCRILNEDLPFKRKGSAAPS